MVKEVERNVNRTTGIKFLIRKYKNQFNIPENLNHYSEMDFQKAEKRYVKYCLQKGRCLMR
jgi:hypothetical protein